MQQAIILMIACMRMIACCSSNLFKIKRLAQSQLKTLLKITAGGRKQPKIRRVF
jgi:hypothetical protein